MICPKCGKHLIDRPEWTPNHGFTGNTVYSHIHDFDDVLRGNACYYVYTEKGKDKR